MLDCKPLSGPKCGRLLWPEAGQCRTVSISTASGPDPEAQLLEGISFLLAVNLSLVDFHPCFSSAAQGDNHKGY